MKKKRMKTTPSGFLDVIPQIKQDKSSVEVTGSPFEQGWHTVRVPTVSSNGWYSKEPEKWNKQDLVKYFYSLHFRKFRTYISRQIPWGIAYQNLEEVRTSLSVQLETEDCGPLIMKEYFDYFYDIHVSDILRGRSSPLSIKDAAKANYIISFLARRPAISKTAKKEEHKSNSGNSMNNIMNVTAENLEAAYKINSRCFIQTYGIVLPVNYLIFAKGFSKEEALAYVKKAVSKICEKDNTKINVLLSITQRFGPYPSWFPFLGMNEIISGNLPISDDTHVYDFLRSLKK